MQGGDSRHGFAARPGPRSQEKRPEMHRRSSQFEEMLARSVERAGQAGRSLPPGECQAGNGQICALCSSSGLEYAAELKVKQDALAEFWLQERLPGALEPIVPSPRGRGYRTVSKRKVAVSAREVRLVLLVPDKSGRTVPLEVGACAIEPPEHAVIYQKVRDFLQKPVARALVDALQYVIIKGNYREFTVILNVRSTDGSLVKAANTLSKSLTRSIPAVVGFFLYEDDSGSEYYMGTRDPRRQPVIRRLFGKDTIYQQVAGKHFLFSPLSFSQVNLSIVSRLVETAGRILPAKPVGTFFDLYCGYGLFAICLADRAERMLGVELSAASVQAAGENARRNRATNARFIRNDITEETIGRVVREAGPADAALLDPPRNGIAPGVIEAIAARRIGRIAHLFCNIDIVGRELERWESSGYRAVRAIPFDMFPGTGAVEIMVELAASPGR